MRKILSKWILKMSKSFLIALEKVKTGKPKSQVAKHTSRKRPKSNSILKRRK